MIWARILWTICATATASAIAWAAHDWASALRAETPYQLWPLAGIMYVWAYLFAGGVLVLGGIAIYTIWTDGK